MGTTLDPGGAAMAGRGPAPKDPALRRNRNTKARGEWQDIPRESGLSAPALPRRARGAGQWSTLTRNAWRSWWADGAALEWTPADEVSVLSLAFLFEEQARGNLKVAAEVRLRMDGLGLTPKGKRDLRLRPGGEAPLEETTAEVSELEERRRARDAQIAAGL